MAGMVPFDRVELDLRGAPLHVHLLGIGGAGMSAIAEVLVALGHVVSGTDIVESTTTRRLRDLGVRVEIGHRGDNLRDATHVAVSTAISADTPEIVAASARGIAVMHRYDLLAAISATRSTLSVSGTHGKTTTSALLALALDAAGADPSFIIGSTVSPYGTGSRWSDGPWLVLEADESDSTFLAAVRRGAIVTNVEPDHLDHHGSWEDLLAAFRRFVAETDGPTVICADDPGAVLLANASSRTLTYGTSTAADARILDERHTGSGSTWQVSLPDGSVVELSVDLPGHHLVLNATAALVLAWAVGIDPLAAATGIAGYRGVGRRFEERGAAEGVRFVDDYAHMPTEVRAVLSAASSGPDREGRLVAVFQPHRYSRTASVWADYAGAFDAADVVVITEVYAAGEHPIDGVDGALVLRAVREASPDLDVRWMATRAELIEGLTALLQPGDLCLTMGAGDLTTLPDQLIDQLTAQGRS